jgi:hypothetical protein
MEECHIICQLQLEDLENSFDINIDNKYTKLTNSSYCTHTHTYTNTHNNNKPT